MKKKLWKVTFDVKYTKCKDALEDTCNVVANSGMSAVLKANKIVLRVEFDDNGVICHATKATLTGLEMLHEIDG